MFSIWFLSNLRALGQTRYSTEFIGRIIGESRSTPCLTGEIRPRRSSHIYCNGGSMFQNSSFYFGYSSGMTINLCKSACFWVGEGDGDGSCSVMMIRTTLGNDCSSSDNFCGTSELTIVDTLSITRSSILFLLRSCCFQGALVTRIRNRRLEIASTTPLAGRHHLATILGIGSEYRKPLALAVTVTVITEKDSSSFVFTT